MLNNSTEDASSWRLNLSPFPDKVLVEPIDANNDIINIINEIENNDISNNDDNNNENNNNDNDNDAIFNNFDNENNVETKKDENLLSNELNNINNLNNKYDNENDNIDMELNNIHHNENNKHDINNINNNINEMNSDNNENNNINNNNNNIDIELKNIPQNEKSGVKEDKKEIFIKGVESYKNENKEEKEKAIEMKFIEKNYTSCKAIFSINSGRTGSSYLYKLLSYANSIISYHEHNSDTWARFYVDLIKKTGYDSSYDRRRLIKRSELNEVFNQNKIYSETSHLFVKTFYDVTMDELLENNCEIHIIILRRFIPEVIHSLHRLNFETDEKTWYYTPESFIGLTDPLWVIDPVTKLGDSYEKIISYLIDIEAQVIKLKELYGGKEKVSFVDVRLEEIQSYDEVISLFSQLNLSLNETNKENFIKQLGRAENKKIANIIPKKN